MIYLDGDTATRTAAAAIAEVGNGRMNAALVQRRRDSMLATVDGNSLSRERRVMSASIDSKSAEDKKLFF